MDGGYVIKRLRKALKRSPTALDVQNVPRSLVGPISQFSNPTIYRILFYNADPYRGKQRNPISGEDVDFAATPVAARNARLLADLSACDNFAIRRGELAFQGWKIGQQATQEFKKDPNKTLQASDLVPSIRQKGVDMRIGLDIAAMALKKLVDTVIVVSGDTDMIPAMRLARREGLSVGLCTLGFRGIRDPLRANADFILDWKPTHGSLPI